MVYLDREIHRALKIKAAQSDSTLSQLVNDAVAAALREDLSDLEAIRKRARESSRSFEAVLKDLKRDGLL